MSKDNTPAFGDLPAFPIVSEIMGHSSGITVRDLYALVALAGVPQPLSSLHDIEGAYMRTASHCYRMADAIRARSET